MDDDTEPTLLAAIQQAPGDDDARMVYADWLEQHGHDVLARFVRGAIDPGVAAISNVEWRAITSCAKLSCDLPDCPGTWNRLGLTAKTRIRSCPKCYSCAIYCKSPREASSAGWKRLPAVLDPQSHTKIEKAFDQARYPWRYGTYNPPPPGSPQPPRKEPFEEASEALDPE
ncbi:MAG TPA: TIGR02996 domain-containing protein [Kofleriaceae bacterium]